MGPGTVAGVNRVVCSHMFLTHKLQVEEMLDSYRAKLLTFFDDLSSWHMDQEEARGTMMANIVRNMAAIEWNRSSSGESQHRIEQQRLETAASAGLLADIRLSRSIVRMMEELVDARTPWRILCLATKSNAGTGTRWRLSPRETTSRTRLLLQGEEDSSLVQYPSRDGAEEGGGGGGGGVGGVQDEGQSGGTVRTTSKSKGECQTMKRVMN